MESDFTQRLLASPGQQNTSHKEAERVHRSSKATTLGGPSPLHTPPELLGGTLAGEEAEVRPWSEGEGVDTPGDLLYTPALLIGWPHPSLLPGKKDSKHKENCLASFTYSQERTEKRSKYRTNAKVWLERGNRAWRSPRLPSPSPEKRAVQPTSPDPNLSKPGSVESPGVPGL